jgi:hypothetical protein
MQTQKTRPKKKSPVIRAMKNEELVMNKGQKCPRYTTNAAVPRIPSRYWIFSAMLYDLTYYVRAIKGNG